MQRGNNALPQSLPPPPKPPSKKKRVEGQSAWGQNKPAGAVFMVFSIQQRRGENIFSSHNPGNHKKSQCVFMFELIRRKDCVCGCFHCPLLFRNTEMCVCFSVHKYVCDLSLIRYPLTMNSQKWWHFFIDPNEALDLNCPILDPYIVQTQKQRNDYEHTLNRPKAHHRNATILK